MSVQQAQLAVTDVTSKIRAIRQLSVFAALGQDADDAVLDEVHLFPDGSLPDDVVARLEDLEAQLGQHGGHKVWIGVGEQGHGGHQLTTVEVDDLLQEYRDTSCYWCCVKEVLKKAAGKGVLDLSHH